MPGQKGWVVDVGELLLLLLEELLVVCLAPSPCSSPFPSRPPSSVQGSQAYAKALAKAGVLTADEATQIVEGLAK